MLRLDRAPVRPRFVSPATKASLPLEDAVQTWLDEGEPACLKIAGGTGSGKTTALVHLAAVYGGLARLTFLDEGRRLIGAPPTTARHLIVFAGRISAEAPVRTLTLAPWSRDELIEYLLATHPQACAAVLSRITPADERAFKGVPELWRVALEELAGDASLGGPAEALVHYIQRRVPDSAVYAQLEASCFDSELRHGVPAHPDARAPVRPMTVVSFASHPGGLQTDVLLLMRHGLIRRILAARHLVAQVEAGDPQSVLKGRLPRDMVAAAGARLKNSPEGIATLEKAFKCRGAQPMAASLLHAANPAWVPPTKKPLLLQGAYLDGVRWPQVQLPKANLAYAELSQADLRRAKLEQAIAKGAVLSLARLSGALLNDFSACNADFSEAELAWVRGARAIFVGSDLSQARLDKAILRDAAFQEADLRGASLRGAVLTRAGFQRALLDEADFSGANLNDADLSELDLRTCLFEGASFRGARLMKSDLEGACLDELDLSGARLEEAILTGTSIVRGNLEGACLRYAGLGDIDWPRACLCGADLRNATFHMGSSRSGLVNSPIASEGSRTGFYTDEFTEQDFKAPEEIRKANLCFADLRGALVAGVDFYLVDLRGARYDADQADHFRRSGAILEDRCSS